MDQALTTTSLFFLANLLYCVSYTVRDILWLRLLAVVAAASTYPYFYFQHEPLYSALFWQSAFLAINLVHAGILIAERRPVPLSDEQRRLHKLAFGALRPREMLRLIRIAEWRSAQPGEILIEQGMPSERLILIYHGVVKVTSAEVVHAHLTAGQFGGEMSLLTGMPTSADLVVEEETRYLCWQSARLNEMFRKHPTRKQQLTSILGLEMAAKLRRGNTWSVAAV